MWMMHLHLHVNQKSDYDDDDDDEHFVSPFLKVQCIGRVHHSVLPLHYCIVRLPTQGIQVIKISCKVTMWSHRYYMLVYR